MLIFITILYLITGLVFFGAFSLIEEEKERLTTKIALLCLFWLPYAIIRGITCLIYLLNTMVAWLLLCLGIPYIHSNIFNRINNTLLFVF